MDETDYFALSDAEMAAMNAQADSAPVTQPTAADDTVVADTADTPAETAAVEVVADGADDAGDAAATPAQPEAGTDVTGSADAAETTATSTTEEPVVDYAQKFQELLAPLQANGKSIEIRSPEELRELASLGANYTKKMQAIAPVRRIAKMLEANQMLDEAQVSFAIDLVKGKPEAIAKLMESAKIDPLSMDAELATQYQPNAHQVTDNQLALDDVLTSLEQSDHGNALLSHIPSWDEQSRVEVVKQPSLLNDLARHKQEGIYDQILSEIDRQHTFGKLQNVPFLQAYKLVGDFMHENSMFQSASNQPSLATQQLQPPAQVHAPAPAAVPTRTPVATRAAAPAAPANAAQVAAAAAPTGAAAPAKESAINYFDLPDDSPMLNWSNRV